MNTCTERVQRALEGIRDAKAMIKTGRMLTWATCAAIGRNLSGLTSEEMKQAKRELASDGEITERYVEMHLGIWRVWEAAGLPDEAMQIVKHATVRYAVEEWGPEEAAREIIAIHDGDESLFRANARRLHERLREAKKKGKAVMTKEALLGALGPLAKVPLDQLSEADRRQIMGALAEILGATATEGGQPR